VSPGRDMPSWSKSPVHLQEAFANALERFPDVERRQMFGYPAAFLNGNMWTGLHTTNWVVRLPDAAREELLRIAGARAFEPMPGRPMTGFATLPPSVLADPEALHGWLSRAWQHAATMAPKEPKAKSRKR
jgi:TfoX/Sxy family transcriptional regulator of competence genes